jgi:hypothetical protein
MNKKEPSKQLADPGTANDILRVKTISKSKRFNKPITDFTPPSTSSNKPKQKIDDQETKPQSLDLESLRLDPRNRRASGQNSGRTRISRIKKALEKGLPLTQLRTKNAINNYMQQAQMQREKVLEYRSHQQTRNLLKQSNLNFHFIPPEGMKETQFNEINKVLFSFKKRMFITYVNSFITQYDQISLERPLLKKSMQSENHTLTGKITFDLEGNIVKINILKSSLNDDVHRLFEETLMGVGSLHNPPKILIEGKDKFVIYYQLKIN